MDSENVAIGGIATLIGALSMAAVSIYRERSRQKRADDADVNKDEQALRGELMRWLRETREMLDATLLRLSQTEQRLRETLDSLHATQRERDSALRDLEQLTLELTDTRAQLEAVEIALRESRRISSEELQSAIAGALLARERKK